MFIIVCLPISVCQIYAYPVSFFKGTVFIICARITFCKENMEKAYKKTHPEHLASCKGGLDIFDRKDRIKYGILTKNKYS